MVANASRLARVIRVVHRIEDGVLAALLGAMILLAAAQIVLRNLGGGGFSWGDPLLRTLVLWLGLLAALAATRADRHITIDAVGRVLSPRGRQLAGAVTSAFAAAVCGVVALQAVRFVAAEREAGTVAFAEVPAWVLEAILPFAFGLIALRYLALAVVRARGAAVGHPPR